MLKEEFISLIQREFGKPIENESGIIQGQGHPGSVFKGEGVSESFLGVRIACSIIRSFFEMFI